MTLWRFLKANKSFVLNLCCLVSKPKPTFICEKINPFLNNYLLSIYYIYNVKKHLKIFKNRYFYTSFALLLILFIFEDTNIFNLFKMKSELKEIQIQNVNKENEIKQVKLKTYQLSTNKAELEKFAREHYLMKKNDEVIYLFK